MTNYKAPSAISIVPALCYTLFPNHGISDNVTEYFTSNIDYLREACAGHNGL
jgi:hypothetical protein